jgi:hypothetical protein
MVKIKRVDEEDDVDYGDIADQFAERNSDDESSDEDEEAASDDGSSSGADGDADEHGRVEHDDDEEELSDEDQDEENEEEEEETTTPMIRSTIKSTEPCTFDMRNLLAMNTHGVDVGRLYKAKRTSSDDHDDVTIAPGSLDLAVDEEYLLGKAMDGCSQLLSVLWQLPVERSDAGPLGSLPKFDELPLPRSLPPPPPKQMTKWEKFAKEKGIALNCLKN